MAVVGITSTDQLRQADHPHRAVVAWERHIRQIVRAAPSTIRRLSAVGLVAGLHYALPLVHRVSEFVQHRNTKAVRPLRLLGRWIDEGFLRLRVVVRPGFLAEGTNLDPVLLARPMPC